jgi:hypothetical protein
MSDDGGFAANQSSRDGSVHDRLHRIPRKVEHRCGGIDGAAGLKNLDSEGFKEKGESGMLRRPRWYDRLHPMLGTPAAGKTSDNLRDELHGVQMPPPSLFGVISQPAGSSTLRAGNATADMSEANLDAPLIDLKVHVLHLPGFIDSEEAGIMG